MNGIPGQAQNRYPTATAQPVTQAVPGALIGLEETLANLHDRLGLLEQRLNAVLTPPPPASVSDGAKLARHSLALQLDSIAASVAGARDRVDSLINRLEL